MIFNVNEVKSLVNITGVLHIGAFVGEELSTYRNNFGLFNTILFEPQEHLFRLVEKKLIGHEMVLKMALGSEEGNHEMYISHTPGGVGMGSGGSSSLLKPKVHLTEHPTITFPTKEQVTVRKLDNVMTELAQSIDTSKYNFLNIDVQGYELEVLKGATETLKNVDGISLEVNRDEVYENCAQIEEIDEYLKGFDKKLIIWQSTSWGDALYVRN